eukprot:1696060-Pleurochrysis_carterae.AAC.1
MIGEEQWQASSASGENKAKSKHRRFVIVRLVDDKRVCWVPSERIKCCSSPQRDQASNCRFPRRWTSATTQPWQRSRRWCT